PDTAARRMMDPVYGRGASASSVSRAIVATDDRRIADAVEAFGGEARLTSPAHESGTDRLAEVAASLDCALIVNVQGDEPLLAPQTIDTAVAPFAEDTQLEMSTLRRRIADAPEHANPHTPHTPLHPATSPTS